MTTSVLLAKLLGALFVVLGVSHLGNLKHLKKILKDFGKTPSLIYFGGIILTIMGLLMVLVHNYWVADWRLIITLLAWLVLGKGVSFLLAPQWVVDQMKHFKHYKKILPLAMVFYILMGVYLLTLGFFVY